MEFQLSSSILKRWCCESAALNMPANVENSAVATGLERSVFIPTPKKDNAKECLTYLTIVLLSHASKVTLKSLQARLNSGTVNFQMFKLDLEKEGNQRSNCQLLLDHQKSEGVPEKHLFLLSWLCQSLWLCGSQQTVENSERDGNTRPPDLPPGKSVCRSGSNS